MHLHPADKHRSPCDAPRPHTARWHLFGSLQDLQSGDFGQSIRSGYDLDFGMTICHRDRPMVEDGYGGHPIIRKHLVGECSVCKDEGASISCTYLGELWKNLVA